MKDLLECWAELEPERCQLQEEEYDGEIIPFWRIKCQFGEQNFIAINPEPGASQIPALEYALRQAIEARKKIDHIKYRCYRLLPNDDLMHEWGLVIIEPRRRLYWSYDEKVSVKALLTAYIKFLEVEK